MERCGFTLAAYEKPAPYRLRRRKARTAQKSIMTRSPRITSVSMVFSDGSSTWRSRGDSRAAPPGRSRCLCRKLVEPGTVGLPQRVQHAQRVGPELVRQHDQHPPPSAEYGTLRRRAGFSTKARFENWVFPLPLANAFWSPSSVSIFPPSTATQGAKNCTYEPLGLDPEIVIGGAAVGVALVAAAVDDAAIRLQEIHVQRAPRSASVVRHPPQSPVR